MSKPLVSVIMNCYNGDKYLNESIDSILNQTYSNWELVFWDNRSTDNSAKVVSSYNDPRIRYFLAPTNTRLGEARRLATEFCLGEYISFLDTDDIYMPENLARKVDLITKFSADVFYSGSIHVDENGRTKSRHKVKAKCGNVFEDLLYQFDIDVATMMLKRSIIAEKKINFDGRIYGSEEYDLFTILSVEHLFIVSDEYLAKVRIRRRSLTYIVMDKWAEDRRLTLRKIQNQYPDHAKRYKNAMKEAFARADYYQARWLVSINKRSEALELLYPVIYTNWRYCALYLILLVSKNLWNLVHRYLPSYRGD
jgi:glycosyltransferase involved in cell wall biosynthesis